MIKGRGILWTEIKDSCQNHGVCGGSLTLPGEDPRAFDTLRENLASGSRGATVSFPPLLFLPPSLPREEEEEKPEKWEGGTNGGVEEEEEEGH